MQENTLGGTGRQVSVIGLGAWQLGADWGDVNEDAAFEVLNTAVDSGVTFIDTADVYGDGRSEQLIGSFLKQRSSPGRITVASKMGRRVPQTVEAYTLDNFRAWNDRSRANLGVDTIDLVQLHCPPDGVYASDQVFDDLDTMVAEGRIAAYGVSVETCDQALAAIARPNVASVQIILNMLRLKPLEQVLPAALAANVGIIARVPLASGLLSGRYDEHTTFSADDHRNYNRHGESFDVGETFSGVPFDLGLRAVARLKRLAPDTPLPQLALRWIIDQPGVSVVIPGARNAAQAKSNADAAALPPVSTMVQAEVIGIYDDLIRPAVHHRW